MGRHSWLCLLAAQQSRWGFTKASATRRGHAPVATMDHKQPNVVNVRNGPSRGRSRSVSRSRSRSRSPPAAREPRDDARHDLPSWWRAPTNAGKVSAGLLLRRYTENDGDTVTLRELKAVCGPKAEEALVRLLEASNLQIKLDDPPDDPIPIGMLARGVGPETMPWMSSACLPGFSGDFSQLEDPRGRSLLNILCAINYTRDPEQVAKKKELDDAFLQLKDLLTMGRKISLDELDKKVYSIDQSVLAHGPWMALMMTVANKHPDVGLDTMIDVDVLAAETGPNTMPLPMLIKLVLTTPANNLFRAPATTQGHVRHQPLHDEGYHRREQQLEEFRRKLAADRERDARAARAATTYPHAQGFFAPAPTQGYVQQQPSIFNPALSRMQQELYEQMRSDPVLRWLRS